MEIRGPSKETQILVVEGVRTADLTKTQADKIRVQVDVKWLTLALLSMICLSEPALGDPLACEREMTKVAQESGIPLNILFSVALTETGHRGALNPFDLNVDGRTIRSATLAEAMKRLTEERALGAKLIDVGCMQINIRWHGAQFRSIEEMFDSARNVAYAAAFLMRLKARYGTWTLAVARYNAGPDNKLAQRQYVCNVIGNMVRSGFGAWTAGARAYCGGNPTLGAAPPQRSVALAR
jgi:hypothetical protein